MSNADPLAPAPRRLRPSRPAAVAAAAVLAAALLTTGFLFGRTQAGADDDLASMQPRAAEVMPFDLDATTHTFDKTGTGGVETVLVKDPSDRANRDLIRGHLRKEAADFAKGDFSDPAEIHGADMPGLKTLERAAGRLQVTYSSLAGGARISYRSASPEIVAAIHDWFDAQSQDHGMPGMGG